MRRLKRRLLVILAAVAPSLLMAATAAGQPLPRALPMWWPVLLPVVLG